MPLYSFQLSQGLAGSSVSVTAAGSTDVVASGTLDTDARFAVSLPVGDYVATVSGGHYSYRSAGTVAQSDPDQLADLSSTFVAQGSVSRSPSLWQPVRPTQTMVTTMQSGHGWTTTGSTAGVNLNDTTDYVLGSQAAKFSTVTSGPANATLDSPVLGTPIDLTGKALRILVKVENTAGLNALRFYVGDSTFANATNYNLNLNEARVGASYLKDGQWTWVTLNNLHGSLIGTGGKSAVTKFRISSSSLAGQAVTIHLGAVSYYTPPALFPNGVVSICFDDGRLSPWTLAKPKLDALGWAASEYPIIDKVAASDGSANYMSPTQLKQLRDISGWEIGVHSNTATEHDAGFDTLTPAQVEANIVADRQWLYDHNLGKGEGFAWPLGVFTKAVEDAAMRLCAYGRANTSASLETWPPANIGRIRSTAVAPSTTLAQLQGQVDQTKSCLGWLCLTFHDLTTNATATGLEWKQSDFITLMDYIAAQGLTVLPVIDVLRKASGSA